MAGLPWRRVDEVKVPISHVACGRGRSCGYVERASGPLSTYAVASVDGPGARARRESRVDGSEAQAPANPWLTAHQVVTPSDRYPLVRDRLGMARSQCGAESRARRAAAAKPGRCLSFVDVGSRERSNRPDDLYEKVVVCRKNRRFLLAPWTSGLILNGLPLRGRKWADRVGLFGFDQDGLRRRKSPDNSKWFPGPRVHR